VFESLSTRVASQLGMLDEVAQKDMPALATAKNSGAKLR
jgi:hypothetical protein